MADWFGKDTPKLGFGLMRLPRRGVSTDIAQVSDMVDSFLDAGFTYFDTAHVYPRSESAIRKALVERHPRESYTLATKLYAPSAPTVNAAKKQFRTSLDRTGAGYIDYYLLHSLDGIITVLSGMSNRAQMDDNISYMRDFRPLTANEQEIIRQAQVLLGKSSAVACTSCHYCTDGCPMSIPIPEIFSALNLQLANGQLDGAKKAFAEAISAPGASAASACVACGQCEGACPQHLPIIKLLAQAAETLEQ